MADILEGAFRPGFFVGVSTVVHKLFNIVQPTYTFFGQKDISQCILIQRMVRDLNMPVNVKVCPTIREHDGLAMSSRNGYLGTSERIQAAQLQQALADIVAAVQAGEHDVEALCAKARRHLNMGGWRVDYIALRDAATLGTTTSDSARLVVLGAAWMGKTRLIDNLDFTPSAQT
ncbi:MAG: hypothetical protein B7Y33_03510 [Hydrogenophilales bacterium 16-62-9]|nr:MAG: hypothetical protein B7Y33_03510 [Hydrogenophilales bacterium 16-62-9]